MISCTEFIPAYSELFTWLEEKKGREEVDRYWKWLFDPSCDSIPLDGYLEREGLKGCFSYWAVSLNEEACDFTMMLNEKQGWYRDIMHHCPSKGRLLELQKEVPEFVPYHDYCMHCDNYRLSLEKAGLKYIYDFNGIDHAACSELIYDPKIFDGRIIVDENTVIMDRKASDNAYFHPQFHAGMSNGIEYLGENYGEDAIREYLTAYMHHVFPRDLEKIQAGGLPEVAAHIERMYAKEHAAELVSCQLSENGKKLTVIVKKDPSVAFLRENGLMVSKWHSMTSSVPYQVLADAADADFRTESYDPETGAAVYTFRKSISGRLSYE